MASIEAKSQHAILGNLGGSLSAMLGGTAFRLRSVADYGGTCHAVHLRSGWNPTLQMLKPSLQHNIFCAERFTPGKSRGSVPSRPGLAETGHVWFHPTSFFLLRSANYEGQVELRRTGRTTKDRSKPDLLFRTPRPKPPTLDYYPIQVIFEACL